MRQRVDFDLEVRTAESGTQISNRCAATLIVLNRGLVRPHAFLLRAVEVIRIRVTGLLARFDKGIKQHVAFGSIGHTERTIAAVEGAGTVLVAFGLTEIGQHVGKAPTFKTHLTPEIIVTGMAANVDHAVD